MSRKFFPVVICTRCKPELVRWVLETEGINIKKVAVVKRTRDLLKKLRRRKTQLVYIHASSPSLERFLKSDKLDKAMHSETTVYRYKKSEDYLDGVSAMAAFLEESAAFAA